jgi:hypothetical protein
MIVSRAISIFLRFGEFVCAAIVLGLMAFFINQYDDFRIGPLAREIYTIIIASLSVLFSVVWMIPTTSSMLLYPLDLLASLAWFAAFGILVNYIGSAGCGGIFYWSNINFTGPWCGKWKAAEAFSFIAALFWGASFLVGVFVYHKLSSRDPVATDGTTRRRWGRSHV